MFIIQRFLAVVISVILHDSYQLEIAREVEGGVELLKTGRIELVIPDVLSFTVKSPGGFPGEFRICYMAITTIDHNGMPYFNDVYSCPSDSCLLAVYGPQRAHDLHLEMRGPTIYAEFLDTHLIDCPRLVVDGHANFTILKLPQVPVIVNDAKLPKNDNVKSNSNLTLILVICGTIFVLLLVVGIAGFCICLRFKKKSAPSPNSIKRIQQVSEPPITPTSHCKTSPAIISGASP